MPVIVPLSLSSAGPKKHRVIGSFQFNGSTDPQPFQSVMGYNFSAIEWLVDFSSIKSSAQFAPMKTLQFTFLGEIDDTLGTGNFKAELWVVIDNVQVYVFEVIADATVSTGQSMRSISCAIPIQTNANSVVRFLSFAPNGYANQLFVNFYDYEIEPFTSK